jgi:hypothetical protein
MPECYTQCGCVTRVLHANTFPSMGASLLVDLAHVLDRELLVAHLEGGLELR